MLASARELRKEVAQMFAPPPLVSVSQGIADTMRTPTGPYKADLVGYMAQPADRLASRRYGTVVFLGPGRCSKTLTLIDGWIARNVVHAPGDMLVVQASQDLARYYSKFRVSRMIDASEKVAERQSPRRQDDNTFDKVFKSGMVLSIGWPSGAQLSGRDFRYVAVTEYDLAADDIDEEGSLYALAAKRIETFGSSGKVVVESSVRRIYRDPTWRAPAGSPHMAPPTTGITGLYNSGTRCWYYWRCPDCGAWMPLHPDVHVMFALPPLEHLVEELEDRDPVQWSVEHATVPCRACGSPIEERLKHELNRSGVWVPDGCEVHGDREIVGEARATDIDSYHLSSVAAAYARWPKVLEKYAVAIQAYARTGDEVDIKSTVNLDQGRAYLPLAMRSMRSVSELQERAKAETWPEQHVPAGVRCLTAQVDIQAGKNPRFVVQVHGIGVNRERWIIDRYALKSSERPTGETRDGNPAMHPIDPSRYIEDWDRLIPKVIERRYPLADGSGRTMPVRFVVSDLSGKEGVTARAYEFWRRLRKLRLHHRFRFAKGAERKMVKTIDVSFPDTSKRIDRNSGATGDVPVLIVNTTDMKDLVMADIHRPDPGPGYYHFPSWLRASFFEELEAEQRGEDRWERIGSKPNESIDLCVMGEVALRQLGLDKVDWTKPPTWADEWDKNPDVRPEGAPAPPPPQHRTRGNRSSGVSVY